MPSPSTLPSFPTRRSSDLDACPAARIRARNGDGDRGHDRPRRASAPSTTARRSEEHTSELQSLRQLVCRLLLEKKKNEKHKVIQEVGRWDAAPSAAGARDA